jgi:Fe-S cluster assembly ATP-binding protein
MMLTIRNLHAKVDDKEILRGVNLQLNAGEVHAIMGPNGSGKSTLAGVLAGRDFYEVTEGQVLYNGQDLLELDPEERAREGIFLAFQYPVEIPGVSNTYFLRAALNAIRKHRELAELDAPAFLKLVKEKLKVLHIDSELLKRPVNEGFSGGRSKERGILVITHYQRLLNYIVPDRVHVLFEGRIVKSGGKELALELEEKGYGWLEEAGVQTVS